MLSTSSASTVDRWHPPLTPPLTAVALHPPPPCPMLALALVYPRSWSASLCPSSTSFALLPLPNFLCTSSFALKLAASRRRLQAPRSFPPPCCCPAPCHTSSCPPLSEWPPSLQSHHLQWLIVVRFLSPVHHLVFPLCSIMQSRARAMLDRT